MKKLLVFTLACILSLALYGCGGDTVDPAPDSSPQSSQLTPAVSEASSSSASAAVAPPLDRSDSEPEVSPVVVAQAPPPHDSALVLTFRVRDQAGNPVAKLQAGLEGDGGTSYYPLLSPSGELLTTGDDGCLVWDCNYLGKLPSPGDYRLHLMDTTPYSRVEQYVDLWIPEGPALFDVTWPHPHPRDEPVPQTSGIRFLITDPAGKPVPGIQLSGSPYPLETEGDIPEIAILLGPSDQKGVIRWDSAGQAGTYRLHAHAMEGEYSQLCEIRYPGGDKPVEYTIIWNP